MNGGHKIEWFKHDASSIQDAKVKKLLMRHGAVGYAVYFHCLELITSDIGANNITFQLEHDSEIIADNLRIVGTSGKSGQEIVEEMMRTIIDLDLLQENNGFIYGLKILKRLDSSMTSNKVMRGLIIRAKENHKMIEHRHDETTKSHDPIMTGSCKKRTEQKEQIEQKRYNTAPVKQGFKKPSLEEVKEYCTERQNIVDPEQWMDYYTANGWRVGKNSMKDWKATVRTWERNNINSGKPPANETREQRQKRRMIELGIDTGADSDGQ